MHYVSAENLSKSYGIKPLFQNISFHISEGDKIALVARNGSGKSTLLKIIAGKETAETGKVWISKDVDVAFFEQEPQLIETATTLDNIFHSGHPVLNTIKEYEALVENEEDTPDYHHRFSEAMMKMDEMSAWDFDAKVHQILSKLKVHH
ncbi:MAG TPA: ATP-binding cassette domain-containing protein, partial [Flavisolibacter sp.]